MECKHTVVFFFFFLMLRQPPRSPLFPYTTPSRSSPVPAEFFAPVKAGTSVNAECGATSATACDQRHHRPTERGRTRRLGDRKSTRLNSSHANISYAVFCLKKKITL